MIKRRSLPILLAALFLLSAGCDSPSGAPAAQTPGTADKPGTELPATQTPGETPESSDALFYADRTNTIYFPEGTGDADAEYVLTYRLPVFMPEELNCAALNAALSLYEEELTERVRTERLPLADRVAGEAAPSTSV